MSDKPRVFPFGCVILAAGAGTRIGGPKAALELSDGVTFLDRVALLAKQSGADPVIAVVSPGTGVPEGIRAVTNAKAKGEQIESVRLGLAQLTSTSCVGTLVWPVDHPCVQLETVLAIVDGARRSGAPLVVPVHEGRRGHPVFFKRDLWRELVTVREDGARAVVRAHDREVHEVMVGDAGVLVDIDAPDDLRAARASVGAS